MSIKMQKTIRFIPFLNFLLIGIQWLKMFQKGLPIRRLFLTLLIVFSASVVIILPRMVFESFLEFSPALNNIIYLIEAVAIMFVFSCRAIYDQENI